MIATLYQLDSHNLEIDGETGADFIFLGSKITADGDCSNEIKRHLLLGRTVMTNLDSILKIRDIILPTKVRLVSAVQFSRSVCLTLCDPMNCSMQGLLVQQQPPESTQTHVHRDGDVIQLSRHLSSPSPSALNLSQHQGLFQ